MSTPPHQSSLRTAPIAVAPLQARLARLKDELRTVLLAGRATSAIRQQIEVAERDLVAAERVAVDVAARQAAKVSAAIETEVSAVEASWRADLAAMCRPIPVTPTLRGSTDAAPTQNKGL